MLGCWKVWFIQQPPGNDQGKFYSHVFSGLKGISKVLVALSLLPCASVILVLHSFWYPDGTFPLNPSRLISFGSS